MTTVPLVDEITAQLTRLHHFELKAEADDGLIALLKQQNEQQAAEITEIKHRFDLEKQQLRHERDVAVRKAKEVSGIISSLGQLALDGVRKMTGDETPAVMPANRVPAPKHLQTVNRSLPPVKPEHEALLPRPSFREVS